ncbi:MAG: phosphatidate cytidylyltransferase [Bacillus sp. (in: firmicutes)]
MKQRIITAIVAAAIFLPIVIYGNFPLQILLYLMATIGLHELMKMRNISALSFPAVIAFAALWVLLLPSEGVLEAIGQTKVSIFLLAIVLLLIVTVLSKNRFTFDDAGFLSVSILYVAIGFYYIMETRELGVAYVFFVLFTLWATDSGAYFMGKAFGKNKLWPEISPNKTIEGAIGGILFALVVALIFYFTGALSISLPLLLIMAVFIAIFGQLGDLVQSAFKRHYGVKDSGNLLPGHGGILDRTDSWLFVFPILHLLHLL